MRKTSAPVPGSPEALPTPSVLPTRTPTPTSTALPTATPTATVTATVTPTPTSTRISLPVLNGTPVPDLPYEVITAENVHRLREVARYGYPRLLEDNPYRLTADGNTIVVGTTAGIEFYDALTQAKRYGFEVQPLQAFDISPDGRFILTSSGESVTVWTANGEKVREFALEVGETWELNAVGLSADGSLLAVQRNRTDWLEAEKLDLYRVEDGSLVDTVRGMGVQFSPDGKYLATVFDGSLRLYPVAELGTGWEKRLPRQSLPWCRSSEDCSLTFSSDGTLAAVVRANRVDVYQVESRRLVRQVSGWKVQSADMLPSVQFTPQGGRLLIRTKPLFAGYRKIVEKPRIILVDIASGEWLMNIQASEDFAYSDGQTIREFRWRAEREMPEFYYLRTLLSVDNQGNVLVTDSQFKCLNEICTRLGANEIVVVGNEGLSFIEVTRKDKRITVNLNRSTIQIPEDENMDEMRVAGNVVIARYHKGMRFWAIIYAKDRRYQINDWVMNWFVSNDVLALNIFHNGTVFTLLFDTVQWSAKRLNLDKVALFYDETIVVPNIPAVLPFIELISLKKSAPVIQIPVKRWKMSRAGWQVHAAAFSKAGNILMVEDGNGGVYVVDVASNKLVFSKELYGREISAMAFSPDGRFFATESGGLIRVWAVLPEDAPVR